MNPFDTWNPILMRGVNKERVEIWGSGHLPWSHPPTGLGRPSAGSRAVGNLAEWGTWPVPQGSRWLARRKVALGPQ